MDQYEEEEQAKKELNRMYRLPDGGILVFTASDNNKDDVTELWNLVHVTEGLCSCDLHRADVIVRAMKDQTLPENKKELELSREEGKCDHLKRVETLLLDDIPLIDRISDDADGHEFDIFAGNMNKKMFYFLRPRTSEPDARTSEPDARTPEPDAAQDSGMRYPLRSQRQCQANKAESVLIPKMSNLKIADADADPLTGFCRVHVLRRNKTNATKPFTCNCRNDWCPHVKTLCEHLSHREGAEVQYSYKIPATENIGQHDPEVFKGFHSEPKIQLRRAKDFKKLHELDKENDNISFSAKKPDHSCSHGREYLKKRVTTEASAHYFGQTVKNVHIHRYQTDCKSVLKLAEDCIHHYDGSEDDVFHYKYLDVYSYQLMFNYLSIFVNTDETRTAFEGASMCYAFLSGGKQEASSSNWNRAISYFFRLIDFRL